MIWKHFSGTFFTSCCCSAVDFTQVRTYLAFLLQPSGLFAVDVALHAGLSSADERGVPQGESSKSYCYRAAIEGWEGEDFTSLSRLSDIIEFSCCECCSPGQDPEEDDALMTRILSEAVVWRRRLIVSLKWAENTVH